MIDNKPIITYIVTAIVDGNETSFHEFGTDPDDCIHNIPRKGLQITKLQPILVYYPATNRQFNVKALNGNRYKMQT